MDREVIDIAGTALFQLNNKKKYEKIKSHCIFRNKSLIKVFNDVTLLWLHDLKCSFSLLKKNT